MIAGNGTIGKIDLKSYKTGFIIPALLLTALAMCPRILAGAQVDARLDTAEIRIGDPLTLTLSVRSGPGETVRFPDPAHSLAGFEILASSPPERYEEDDGAILERRSYRLTSFETGDQVIPALPFVLMAPDGSVDTVHTREISLAVISLVQDTTAAEVRPLKDLILSPPLWHKLALWAVLVLAALGLALWQARRLLARRAGRLSGTAQAPPPRPAHLVAFEELERIKSLGLIEKGEIKKFHILVSDVVRRYIEAVYRVEAMDMTTWEICESLRARDRIDGSLVTGFREFLEACDLVKFAKYKPPIVEINSVFNRAWELVERTRPAPPVQQSPEEQESVVSAGARAGVDPGGEG